ncbi:hypothetical protein BCR34DRAFT_376298 [Clohesyomyces aquaticus]|uniref:Uncharacterized protein n=1 Tax=Clohesyomyces aquaticus TaxID=1231657 RepID=A0A1Y1ZG54_9PLEO|nr:hypothetical protein BCR34DRAFT_376298 [Clohesyomyces aquaticus]
MLSSALYSSSPFAPSRWPFPSPFTVLPLIAESRRCPRNGNVRTVNSLLATNQFAILLWPSAMETQFHITSSSSISILLNTTTRSVPVRSHPQSSTSAQTPNSTTAILARSTNHPPPSPSGMISTTSLLHTGLFAGLRCGRQTLLLACPSR